MKVTFKKSQRIRIIANDIVIYTTVGQSHRVIGTGWVCNATLLALLDLQANGGRGIVRSYQDKQIQVDLLEAA
jgi:hypothetical protein